MSKKVNLLKFQDLIAYSKQPVRKKTLVSKYVFIAVMQRVCMIQGTLMRIIRVRTGHGKPGKSWNLRISFPGLESHGIQLSSLKVVEN